MCEDENKDTYTENNRSGGTSIAVTKMAFKALHSEKTSGRRIQNKIGQD